MEKNNPEFEQELHAEFLQALHAEKIKTQGERANYVTSKFAFITGLFGLGALQIGTIDFSMLLYFIPLVAIGYDLYIRAADLSIKKIGAFLRSDPQAGTTKAERSWEQFAASHRDKLAQLATTLFSFIIIVGAAVFIFIQQRGANTTAFWVGYPIWFVISLVANGLLWHSHRKQVKKLDDLSKPETNVVKD